MSTNDVLFDEISGQGGNLGVITLNRPEVLNSLNIVMIHAMHAQLQSWATNDAIKAVVIRAAEGRAFCAGGDLRLTYERFKAHDKGAADFFRHEYQLNRCIFHYPKPYIALLDGITMGGGVGISIHGSHRIATERLVFAMPETGIGFFPDVGGTYFLPRLSGRLGFYLGLTGARLGSDDCVSLGIAQHKVARDGLSELLDTLAQHAFRNDARASVTEVISQYNIPVQSSTLLEHEKQIDACFSHNSMEEVISALQQSMDPLCIEAAKILHKKSPTSLKITLYALQQDKQLDFDACMRQEYRLACRFTEGHDFLEGIRAVIIDKDQMPHWKPNTLEGVTPEEVEKYFAPLSKELV
jgi:enoyl-CoA hydratase/carnithine racemase